MILYGPTIQNDSYANSHILGMLDSGFKFDFAQSSASMNLDRSGAIPLAPPNFGSPYRMAEVPVIKVCMQNPSTLETAK